MKYLFNLIFLAGLGCGGATTEIDQGMFYEDFGTHNLQFTSCHSTTNGEDLDATARITNIPSDEYKLILDNDTELRLFLKRTVVSGVGIVWKDNGSELELIKHEDGSITYDLSGYQCVV
jgi:hypothetical protein